MNDNENRTCNFRYSDKFYERLNEFFACFKQNGKLPDKKTGDKFSDGKNMFPWLHNNLYKLIPIRDEDERVRILLDAHEKKKNDKNESMEEIFYRRLDEVYKYYLKNNSIPKPDSDVVFIDGVRMGPWIRYYLTKIEEIKDENSIANKIYLIYTKKQEDKCDIELSLTSRVNEIYEYYIDKKELPGKNSNIEFADHVNMGKWLEKNISKLYEYHSSNPKISVIFNAYVNKQKNESNALENDVIQKISEIYLYLSKNQTLPDIKFPQFLSDGTNIREWVESNINILEKLKRGNLYINTIVRAYTLEIYKKRSQAYQNIKIGEFYDTCMKYGLTYIFEKKLKFSDNTDMCSWFLRNLKRLSNNKKDNRVNEILEQYQNIITNDKIFLNKVEEIFQYYKETSDILMENVEKKFSDGNKYRFWIRTNINKLRKIKYFNKKAYILVRSYNFKKSMIYNKKLIELSNMCLVHNQIPDVNSICKFSDGKYMSIWFSSNRTNIWNNRKTNPYCLKVIRTVLSIEPTYFDRLNTELENIEGNSKIILKRHK